MRAIVEIILEEIAVKDKEHFFPYEYYQGAKWALEYVLSELDKNDEEMMMDMMIHDYNQQIPEENQYDPMWAAQDECCYGTLHNSGDECNCGEMNEEICGSQLEYENELAYRNKAIDENWSEEDKLKLQALREKIANQ
jgi:hypothetical protein